MKRAKTWQEAFKNQGIDPNIMPDTSMLPEEFRKPQEALYKMHIVAKDLNGEWKPDYTNDSQWKYFPYFEVKANKKTPSGVGLSYGGFGYRDSDSGVGVRLCFKDRDTAEYAGKQFVKLYEDLFLHR